MRLSLSSLLFALVCVLFVLPHIVRTQPNGGNNGGLVAASANNAKGRASSTYASTDRDLDLEEEADDDDDVPLPSSGKRSSQQQQHNDDSATPHNLKLQIFESYGMSDFTPRSTVTLNYDSRTASKSVVFSSASSKATKETMTKAVQGDQMYRLMFLKEGGKKEDGIIASVKACSLISSHFHELFTFSVDPYGELLSVSYRTPISACLPSDELLALVSKSTPSFQSKGKISFGRPGEKAKLHIRPGLDVSSQAAAQAAGSEAPPPAATQAPERNADGTPVPPPKTFWEKYWMYIVGLVVFMIAQVAMAPPAPEGAK